MEIRIVCCLGGKLKKGIENDTAKLETGMTCRFRSNVATAPLSRSLDDWQKKIMILRMQIYWHVSGESFWMLSGAGLDPLLRPIPDFSAR